MKKIFFICVFMMSVITMNAAITNMTCAEAAAAAQLLPANSRPGTDSVAVTGYVTNTDGVISRGQQTFWIDDVKGTKKTFEGYWCNIPVVNGSSGDPLNVGDKVTLKGFLMKYNEISEMKNGDVVILEREVINIDTIEVSVCEAYAEGEALNNRDITQNVFSVVGVISQIGSIDYQYKEVSFWMKCEEEGNTNKGKEIKAYHITLLEEDGYMPNIGDTVGLLGKIRNFDETIEIPNGKTWIIGNNKNAPWYVSNDTLIISNNIEDGDNYSYKRSLLYYYHEKIKTIVINEGVTYIGAYAFYDFSNLTSVLIPNSIIKIGSEAFGRCSKLSAVYINNISSWLNIVFDGFYANPLYYANHLYVNNEEVLNLIIPDSVTNIGNGAFRGLINLTSVIIPNSVTSIGAYSFSYCSSLTSVTIPNSVKSIGGYAFYGCSSLTYINIPNSVTSIGNNAFIYCSGLISILLLPETPPTIGSYIVPTNVPIYVPCETLDAYKATDWKNYNIKYVPSPYDIEISINNAEGGNAKVDSLNLCYNSVSAIPNYGYHFTQWSDGISDNPRSIDLIQDTALTAIFEVDKFGVCGDNNMLTWNYADDGLLTISGKGSLNSNYTFGVEAPDGMKQLRINEGVISVGDTAFNGKQLNTIILPQTLTNIGDSAFAGDKVLRNIVIPNNVTTIGEGAFEGGNRLQEITLGESIETIGNNAFKNCPYIITVHANMEFPPVIDASVFADCGELSGIDCYVDQNSLAFYKKTAVWKEFNLVVGQKMFVLTARPNYPDMGSAEGTGAYAAGVEVTLKATAKSGCHFLCWNDGEKEPVRRVVVTNDAVYTALFAADEAKPEEQVNVTITDTTANLNTGLVQYDDVVTYRLVIYYQDTPVCTLSLDREGHLTGIDFHVNAPRRMPQHTMLAAGELNIPITGLHSGTTYHYVLDALDKDNNIIERREGDFTTSGVSTSVDNLFVNMSLEEVLANKETRIYTLQGIEVTNMRERLPQGTYIFRLGDKVGKATIY